MLSWLLDTSMGCPGKGGHWPLYLSILFHLSNLLIASAYLAVPIQVIRLWKYKRDGVKPTVLWSVLAFMPIMSISRLIRFFEIFAQPYRLTALLDLAAAAATWYAVLCLEPLARDVLRLPSRERFHDLVGQLNHEVLLSHVREKEVLARKEELRRQLAEALERVRDLESDRTSSDWWRQKKATIGELHQIIDSIVREEDSPGGGTRHA